MYLCVTYTHPPYTLDNFHIIYNTQYLGNNDNTTKGLYTLGKDTTIFYQQLVKFM
jgi:hypothetical protein